MKQTPLMLEGGSKWGGIICNKETERRFDKEMRITLIPSEYLVPLKPKCYLAS